MARLKNAVRRAYLDEANTTQNPEARGFVMLLFNAASQYRRAFSLAILAFPGIWNKMFPWEDREYSSFMFIQSALCPLVLAFQSLSWAIRYPRRSTIS
jgi:hypothetical protein